MALRTHEGSLKHVALAAAVLAGLGFGCETSDSGDDRPCGGQTCGYIDHQYNSTFYCPPAPLRPGGWYGFSWHDETNCHEECASASSFGCDASGCDAGCTIDHGTGAWLPCNEANGGTVTDSGCFLDGSGVNGETVPCVCR